MHLTSVSAFHNYSVVQCSKKSAQRRHIALSRDATCSTFASVLMVYLLGKLRQAPLATEISLRSSSGEHQNMQPAAFYHKLP